MALFAIDTISYHFAFSCYIIFLSGRISLTSCLQIFSLHSHRVNYILQCWLSVSIIFSITIKQTRFPSGILQLNVNLSIKYVKISLHLFQNFSDFRFPGISLFHTLFLKPDHFLSHSRKHIYLPHISMPGSKSIILCILCQLSRSTPSQFTHEFVYKNCSWAWIQKIRRPD